jgi:hypothetical protein
MFVRCRAVYHTNRGQILQWGMEPVLVLADTRRNNLWLRERSWIVTDPTNNKKERMLPNFSHHASEPSSESGKALHVMRTLRQPIVFLRVRCSILIFYTNIQKLKQLKYVQCRPRPSDSGFGGLVVSMLASGTQDRGFEPDRRIFRAKKSTACLPSEGK